MLAIHRHAYLVEQTHLFERRQRLPMVVVVDFAARLALDMKLEASTALLLLGCDAALKAGLSKTAFGMMDPFAITVMKDGLVQFLHADLLKPQGIEVNFDHRNIDGGNLLLFCIVNSVCNFELDRKFVARQHDDGVRSKSWSVHLDDDTIKLKPASFEHDFLDAFLSQDERRKG